MLLGHLKKRFELLGVALANDAFLSTFNELRVRDAYAAEGAINKMVKARLRRQATQDKRARVILQNLAACIGQLNTQ